MTLQRKPDQSEAIPTSRSSAAKSRSKSRTTPPETQLNLKGPKDVLERFRMLCQNDNVTYHEMLVALMDTFECSNKKHSERHDAR